MMSEGGGGQCIRLPYELSEVEVVPHIKKRISFLNVVNNHLENSFVCYFGSSDGHAYYYTLSSTTSQPSRKLRLAHEFGKILGANSRVIPSWGVIISVIKHSGSIAVYLLNRVSSVCTPNQTLQDTSNVTAFDVFNRTLVVGTKSGELFLYEINRKSKLALAKKISLNSGAISKVLCLTAQHVGITYVVGGFDVVSLQDGQKQNVNQDIKKQVKSISLIRWSSSKRSYSIDDNPERNLILAFTSTSALVLDLNTDDVVNSNEWILEPKGALIDEWKNEDGPFETIFHAPFLIWAFKNRVEIRSVYSFSILQVIPFKSKLTRCLASIEWNQENDEFDEVEDSRVQFWPRASLWLVDENSKVFCLTQSPIGTVAKELYKNFPRDALYLQEATRHLDSIQMNDFVKPMDVALMDYSFMLIRKKEYLSAMFYIASASRIRKMDPIIVAIALLPNDLLPKDSSYSLREIQVEFSKSLSTFQLEGKELLCFLKAFIQLCSYMGMDNSKLLLLDRSSCRLKDTVLLKACVLVDDKASNQLLLNLVMRPNNCDINESEMFLRANRNWSVLLEFYKTKELHEKVLLLLCELNERQESPTVLYLEQMVVYLKTLRARRYFPLVLRYSKLVLEDDPQRGLAIFLHNRDGNPNAALDISQVDILQHLKTCKIKSASESELTKESFPLLNGQLLAIEYAYQEVFGASCHSSELHNELVFLLLDSISQEPEVVPAKRIKEESGLRGHLRRRLYEVLQRSTQYHPERMLSKTPQNMVEERAILYGKLRRHELALQLYVSELNDLAEAENYCDKYYTLNNDSSVYLILLKILLMPNDPNIQPMIEPVLKLITKNFRRLDTLAVLELLPSNYISVSDLDAYLQCVFQLKTDERRNADVTKSLSNIECLQVQSRLYNKQSHYVQVLSMMHPCSVCKKPLYVEKALMPFYCVPGSENLVHCGCYTSPSNAEPPLQS